ncbi:hypothetical protein [Comamonas sp. GB3 AK4-5]|uniref:hypothetical protein n=1 Tax=Comamonas sp. GB3 AK4-5 TaxID=3231487 RepID=UPI00351E3AD2
MKHRLWPTLLLAWLITPAWSQPATAQDGAITACVPDAQHPVVAEPYNGYPHIGYKGALERDSAWFAAVRSVPQPDGTQRYVFRHARAAQRVAYESIETLSLGGKAIGFAAYRQGCGELFDAGGSSLGVPAFASIADAYTASDIPHSVLLKRTLAIANPSGAETAFSYLRFTRGKLVASSPHQYHGSYSLAPIPSANTELHATNKLVISIHPTGGVGLLDLASLHEVLAPHWQGVGQITDFVRSSQGEPTSLPSYLLARDDNGLQLHTLDGQPLALPRFDRIGFIHGWYPQESSQPPSASDPLVIQTQELDDQGRPGPCRLYNEALQPLLEAAVPARYCLRQPERGRPYFAYAIDGQTQVYRKQLKGPLLALERSASDIAGELVYVLDSGALLLQTPTQPPYSLVTPQGADMPERSFDSVQDLGCGFVVVRRGEQRWMLNPDGSLSSGMRYPFSC